MDSNHRPFRSSPGPEVLYALSYTPKKAGATTPLVWRIGEDCQENLILPPHRKGCPKVDLHHRLRFIDALLSNDVKYLSFSPDIH